MYMVLIFTKYNIVFLKNFSDVQLFNKILRNLSFSMIIRFESTELQTLIMLGCCVTYYYKKNIILFLILGDLYFSNIKRK